MKRLEHFDTYEILAIDIFYDESFNCRGSFTLHSICDLAESIKGIGLQMPIIVQPWKNGKYRLIAGHRRYKACTIFLGWDRIPAVVRSDLNGHRAQLLNFTENLERKDLNILEEAKAIASMYPGGISLRRAAAELKRPTRWVHIRQRLLKLPAEIQEMAAAGRLSAVDIEAICQLPEEDQLLGSQRLIKAKRNPGKRHKRVPHRRFRPRRTKQQISKLTEHLMNAGIVGLPTRLLAWTAGYIYDTDIKSDIRKYAPDYQIEMDEVNDGTE